MRGEICFVTKELYEITKNGGIGTATTHIAKTLAREDFSIDVLFTAKIPVEKKGYWRQFYKKQHNINLFFLDWNYCEAVNPWQAKAAYATYQHFKTIPTHYDVIIFHDYLGEGYYCQNAKEAGSLFQNTLLGTILHGPIQWCLEANNRFLNTADELVTMEQEQSCVERSDFIISPSQYIVDWMLSKKWQVPKKTFILQNIIRPPQGLTDQSYSALAEDEIKFDQFAFGCFPADASTVVTNNEKKRIDEIVFFGRLEQRKGIHLFCDALQQLDLSLLGCKKLTFLGKEVDAPESFLQQKLAPIKTESIEITYLTKFDSNQARAYLAEGNKLIIMPSLADNSPCVVMECLEMKLPFITTVSGGMRELIDTEGHSICITQPHPKKLAVKISEYLSQDEYYIPQPSKTYSQICTEYVDTLQQLITEKPAPKPVTDCILAEMPLVTVVITHFNRGQLVIHAVQSVVEQTYKNTEIIVVDDGSTNPYALYILRELESQIDNLRVIYQENAYLGAARNTGIKAARGEFIAFIDDDNYWKKNYLEACMRALLIAEADCVTTGTHFFFAQEGAPTVKDITNKGWLFFGSDLKFSGAMKNIFGDGGGVCRKSSIDKYGLFKEVYNAGHEDWNFFANISLRGGRVLCLPELLCFYRSTNNSMIRTTNKYKNFRVNISAYEENGYLLAAKLAELNCGQEFKLQHEKAAKPAESLLAKPNPAVVPVPPLISQPLKPLPQLIKPMPQLVKPQPLKSTPPLTKPLQEQLPFKSILSDLPSLPSLRDLASGKFHCESNMLGSYYKLVGKFGMVLSTIIPKKRLTDEAVKKSRVKETI